MSDTSVVIIGGGVMGVSLLYHLTTAGWQDVVLLEKNDLTHGSTWHAAGLCTHFAHNPAIQELRARSVRLYRDTLPADTGQSCGFHRSGAMRITSNADRMEEFAHVAGLSEFTGYPLQLLTPDQIAQLHPLAQLDGLIGGIYEPDDGHVDPTLATNAMAQIATQQGATIHRRSPVISITRAGDLWQVETENETFRSKHVVNAAGTWGWEVGQMMGLNIPSVPVLHQYLVTDTVPEIADRIQRDDSELPIIRDPEQSWYVRQERDGLILGPYEADAQVWSVDGCPPAFGAELLPPDLDRVEHIIEHAIKRIPALGNSGIKTVVNGPITFTPDANPLIGPAHDSPNAWLLTGSSMGVMEGGGAGWFLAHWMTHGAPPMDALSVDSRRFGAWADRNYRVAKAVECFGLQFGVHYPYEERPAARNIRLSPLHELMLERGAVMGAVHGWERPNWFSDKHADVAIPSFKRSNWFEAVAAEVACASKSVALADLSVFSKFEITGAQTRDFLNILGANKPPRTDRIGLLHVLTPAGGVASEFTVAMTGAQSACLTSASAAEEMDFGLLQERSAGYDLEIKNVTDQYAVIGVMGPRSRELLEKLCECNALSNFKWLSVKTITIANTQVRALRVSYIGELGWELHVPAEKAAALYLQLESAGKDLNAGYYGAYAANSMRLEKGYRSWGGDLTTERTPLESGLATLVHHEGREFIGRQAMLDKDNPWQMVLLDIETSDIDPFYSHTVFKDNKPVGIVTTAAYGYRTGKTLALAYLRDTTAYSKLTVSVLAQQRRAEILNHIPYDPVNEKLKA